MDLPIYHAAQEVTLDIGDLIDSGQAQPRSAITIDRKTSNGWLLRTEKAKADLRWYRPLLNAHGAAPDLVIDPRLEGTYDVYAQVRAVHAAGASQTNASFAACRPWRLGWHWTMNPKMRL